MPPRIAVLTVLYRCAEANYISEFCAFLLSGYQYRVRIPGRRITLQRHEISKLKTRNDKISGKFLTATKIISEKIIRRDGERRIYNSGGYDIKSNKFSTSIHILLSLKRYYLRLLDKFT